MRRTKMKAAAFVLAAGMMLGGCGDEPYELTDSEEDIIVNYAAHVVTKYNSAQTEGLAYVYPEMLEEEESETQETMPDSVLETEQGAEENQTGALDVGQAESTQESVPETVSLQELFGFSGVEINYVGAYLSPSYVEDTYYALDAPVGKNFLIVNIDVLNLADGSAEFNHLALAPKFAASVNGEAYSSAEMTILTGDFSTLEVSLGGGATMETVLLFKVPDTVTEVESLEMKVSVGGAEYQINL